MGNILGTSAPDLVFEQTERIREALMECHPFDDIATLTNLGFLDTALDAATKISEMIVEVRRIHKL